MGEEFGGNRLTPDFAFDGGYTARNGTHPPDEIYRIAREALRKTVPAFTGRAKLKPTSHNDARMLRASHPRRWNGHDGSLSITGRDGHWGLRGMRERASKIGAQLDILE